MDKWDVGKTYKRPTTCIKRLSPKTGPNRFTKGSDILHVVKKDGGHASSVKRLNIHRKPLSNSTRDAQLAKNNGKTESRFITAAETHPPSEDSGVVPPSERTETHALQVLSKNQRTIKHHDTTVSSADVEMARGSSTTASTDENGLQNGFINDSSLTIPPTNINFVDECIENDGRKTEISSCSADSYGGNSSIEDNLITLNKSDWGDLEECCIFIDVDGHHSISCSRGKQRSYKKTIRDAFSSKKKSSRAQEYEQLVILYDDAVSPEDCSAESRKGGTSEARGSSECDWELL